MPHKFDDLEFKPSHQVKLFIGDALQLLSDHFNGETTINHLRIGHYIGLKSLYDNEPTTNKEISENLNISRSTVSRVVADYIAQGWVMEKQNPDDGRIRQLYIDPDHPMAHHFEQHFSSLLAHRFARAETSTLVPVDLKKKNYQR